MHNWQIGMPQAFEAGRRQDDRVELAGRELGQPGVDIAPQRRKVEVRAQAQRLEAPAQ